MNWNTELEDALRADAYDEGLWCVLEDWTLAQGDDRAHVIELHKAGAPEASTAERQLEPRLLGPKYKELRRAMSPIWRAGYLVRADLDLTALPQHDVLAHIVGLRCSRVMRALGVVIDRPSDLDRIARALVGSAVRELRIRARWKPHHAPAALDPALLAPLSIAILHLQERAIALSYGEALARLQELWLTPSTSDELRELFRGAFPRLEELAIYGRRVVAGTTAFDTLLSAEATPALRSLHLRDANPMLQRFVIEQLAESALLPQLEQFSFDFDRLDLSRVPAAHRDAFERFA